MASLGPNVLRMDISSISRESALGWTLQDLTDDPVNIGSDNVLSQSGNNPVTWTDADQVL